MDTPTSQTLSIAFRPRGADHVLVQADDDCPIRVVRQVGVHGHHIGPESRLASDIQKSALLKVLGVAPAPGKENHEPVARALDVFESGDGRGGWPHTEAGERACEKTGQDAEDRLPRRPFHGESTKAARLGRRPHVTAAFFSEYFFDRSSMALAPL